MFSPYILGAPIEFKHLGAISSSNMNQYNDPVSQA